MSTVEQSIDVHVPVRAAYDQWTQFETFPAFMGDVERIEQLDDTLGLMEANIKRDLASFKEFIGERGIESGAWRGEVEQNPNR